MHLLLVEIELGPLARPVYESLRPETQAVVPSERSRVSLGQEGGLLRLSVAAEDIVSLRAAVNTWLRLIRIAEDMFNTRVIS
jgi:KEOPS complex subunit Pcc1